MIHTPKIELAIRKASRLHSAQKRKARTDLPYVSHLFSVALILSGYTDDEDIIAAGILHDTLEDTEYTQEELGAEFGPRVLEIVCAVSETKEEAGQVVPWRERKERYLATLRSASDEALLVALADKMHNLQTILDDLDRHGPAIWGNFKASKEEQLWFFTEAHGIFKERLPELVCDSYSNICTLAQQKF